MMLRLASIAGLILVFLISTAQAQREQRGRDQRDSRDRFDQRDRRDGGDFRPQGDFRDRSRFPGRGSNFEYLGERRVTAIGEWQSIIVDQPAAWFLRRRFRALQFFVEDNDVEFDSVKLRYQNRYEGPTWPVKQIVRRGGNIEVPIADPVSYIREIDMLLVANPQNPRDARVSVYGVLVSARPPGRDDWVRFGCHPVSILENNTFHFDVGRREGRFMSIRLHALIADIEIWNLKVHYANGTLDEVSTERHIQAERYSQEFHLRGPERSIERIEVGGRSTVLPVDIVLGEKVRLPHICAEGFQHIPTELLPATPPRTTQ